MRNIVAALGGGTRIALAVIALIAALAVDARAELLEYVEGDARMLASPSFATPGARRAYFFLESAGRGRDLREQPGKFLILTADGALVAEATPGLRRFGAWRHDAESRRPLHPDAAEGARCATGAEEDCWRPGDRVPYSTEVAAALNASSVLPPSVGTSSPSLNEVLDDEQQALLGCGPFWRTDCETDGVDVLKVEASVLLQSFIGFDDDYGTHQPATPAPDINSRWQTIGALGPSDPDYDPPIYSVVGTRGGTDVGTGYSACKVAPQPNVPCSNNLTRPHTSGGYGSSSGQQFISEMAMLSYNMQLLLAAFSVPEDPTPTTPVRQDELNPFDPFSRAPHQCSTVQPQYCASTLALLAMLEHDAPRGGDPDWVWEAGAEYHVVEAWGDVADYAGGTVHVLGMERSRTRRAVHGIPVALFPPPGATLDPATPFAVASTSEAEPDHGLAYLTLPEPSGVAGAAIGALLLLARRRSSARR